jgi:hypothetical protein
VIVLASNGYTDTSMGGGTKLLRLHQNGCAGVLTDGRLRDFDEFARYDFAAYCSGEATRWGGDHVTPFRQRANSPRLRKGDARPLAEVREVEDADAAVRDQLAREQIRDKPKPRSRER